MTGSERIGFIGAGNMATAMIKGLLQSGRIEADRILASDTLPVARDRLQRTYGIRTETSNEEVARACPCLVLAVKPQNMQTVLAEIREAVTPGHLLISIAAGIPIARIREGLPVPVPVIRVMPNTPALILKGISVLAPGPGVSDAQVKTATDLFRAVGETLLLEEPLLDAVTALSGSGPGFVFRFMECMAEAGVAAGLDHRIAETLVLHVFRGAAELALQSERSLCELREMVTSKGGTTAAGLEVFGAGGLDTLIREAILAATRRSRELGRTG